MTFETSFENKSLTRMSLTFTLTGQSSLLTYNFNPPIYLDDDMEYEIGLANFDTFNSIPNIDKHNNILVWGENDENKVKIPDGSYELKDIITIILENIFEKDNEAVITITPNEHTAKVNIRTNRRINFSVENSIGAILGFDRRILKANDNYISDHEVKILTINTICIDCNLVMGSYLNGQPVHIIHQFFPVVPAGYKIVESPLNIIYYPVTVKTISSITVKVIDQSGNLIDFRNEEITVRLHLRRKTI